MVRYYPHKHTVDENAIPGIIEAQDQRIAEAFAVLDKQLLGKNYLLGDKISACDFFLFMLAEWSLKVKKKPMAFVNLKRYLKKIVQHPTVRRFVKLKILICILLNSQGKECFINHLKLIVANIYQNCDGAFILK